MSIDRFPLDPALSMLGLGCARIGSFNNPQSMGDARALVQAALDQGVTVIDTSNIYGQGDSERQIGLAVRHRRDSAFLVTKTGLGFSAKMRLLRPLKPLLRPLLAARAKNKGKGAGRTNSVSARRAGEIRSDWRPEAFGPSLDASLRRLRTDRVDGFLLHNPPAHVVADPAVAESLASLKALGKARHWGVSCEEMDALDATLAMPGLTMLQLPWDLIEVITTDGRGKAIRERRIIVLAREIIRLQPSKTPLAAVQTSISNPLVASTLVGTTSRKHLTEIVDGVR